MDTYTQQAQSELNKLMTDFYNLTGIKICIFDGEGNEVCYYPDRFTPFCAYLRSFPALDARCRECDNAALSECKRTQKAIIYTCHAGLTEGVAPILVNGAIKGFIVIGQIKDDGSERFNVEHGDIDGKKLNGYYDRLQVVPREKVQSALHILKACASYEHLNRFVKEMNETLGMRIQKFIDDNLKENLSVEVLCSVFRLSRREIYHIVKKEYNCTPADLVKLRRLNCAFRLIKESDYPIFKIAEECGIGDYNYFSKVFKREFGITAREIRKTV